MDENFEVKMRCPNVERADHIGEIYYPEMHEVGGWLVWNSECPECGVAGVEEE